MSRKVSCGIFPSPRSNFKTKTHHISSKKKYVHNLSTHASISSDLAHWPKPAMAVLVEVGGHGRDESRVGSWMERRRFDSRKRTQKMHKRGMGIAMQSSKEKMTEGFGFRVAF